MVEVLITVMNPHTLSSYKIIEEDYTTPVIDTINITNIKLPFTFHRTAHQSHQVEMACQNTKTNRRYKEMWFVLLQHKLRHELALSPNLFGILHNDTIHFWVSTPEYQSGGSLYPSAFRRTIVGNLVVIPLIVTVVFAAYWEVLFHYKSKHGVLDADQQDLIRFNRDHDSGESNSGQSIDLQKSSIQEDLPLRIDQTEFFDKCYSYQD
ncbi:hypothetical protein PPL_07320 [Heterostelium album PN500]|uniref:Uncharacterized protein n=1 Tax=Heterostelium pallidum (strain ATCC 26659 / Pp 5 / PN500) TaxID=670386 RepID=D3BF04_HETP5|nr:hypothetical protein PPL_07320 [Heterostelium album PN500]EFA80485.1 hypothetical protein PPL_07320 [Heterostelium album PN500]|eukprot:XP_020432605.1 hypothetical protein PPL_07320 [Heterostelium album PN500]